MPSNQFHRVEKLTGECEQWQTVTFQNSWANRGNADDPSASYYKDPFNIVHLKGAVDTGSTGNTIFTLPTGYRPADSLVFPVKAMGTSTLACVDVAPDGTVTPFFGAGTGIHLNNVSFRV